MDYDVGKGEINIGGKVMNKIDKFTIGFLGILTKYSDYVIVSGYVSILLGRVRPTDDVDLLVPEMEFS